MKSSTLFTSLLFGAVLADDAQVPLKDKAAGWFDKAKSYIPSVTPSIPNPLNAGAAAVAAKKVQKVNIRNYERLLAPKAEGEEEWLIYVTGGNKTCYGRCGNSDLAWNGSIPLLSVLPQPAGAPALKLGKIDCENEAVLCAAWAAACPSVFHFSVPQAPLTAGASNPTTPLRITDLNVTSVTAKDIVQLASRSPNSRVMDIPIYDGIFHPTNGLLHNLGLQEYLGYVIYAMGVVPSWVIMIFISFISRQVMSRRALNTNRPDLFGPGGVPAAGPPPVAGAAPPAGAAKPATPGSAGKGGKKRR